jgi:ribosomal protein S18 acetylase RimI-like enzyme
MSHVVTRPADLASASDQAAVVELLDAYARDAMGMFRPLPADVRAALVPRLREHPTTQIVLAFHRSVADASETTRERPAGLALCFVGFSSFRARPLLNIHDFVVHPDFRGQGIGRRLMAAVEEHARTLGCCKVTLEVRADNLTAQRLYETCGFAASDSTGEAMLFWAKDLMR